MLGSKVMVRSWSGLRPSVRAGVELMEQSHPRGFVVARSKAIGDQLKNLHKKAVWLVHSPIGLEASPSASGSTGFVLSSESEAKRHRRSASGEIFVKARERPRVCNFLLDSSDT